MNRMNMRKDRKNKANPRKTVAKRGRHSLTWIIIPSDKRGGSGGVMTENESQPGVGAIQNDVGTSRDGGG